MQLHLLSGFDRQLGGTMIIETGPIIEDVRSVNTHNGFAIFTMGDEASARVAADQLGWQHSGNDALEPEPSNGRFRVAVGEKFVYYAGWELKDNVPHFSIKCGECAAAIMQSLETCREEVLNKTYSEMLHMYSDSGMVGPWVCCAEVAEAAELRYGDMWETQDRDFIEDTYSLMLSIMHVAERIKKQPQGDDELNQVFQYFESNFPPK